MPGRPARLRIPGWAVRLQTSSMARLLLTGQQVLPGRAQAAGFEFRHPELAAALKQILRHD